MRSDGCADDELIAAVNRRELQGISWQPRTALGTEKGRGSVVPVWAMAEQCQ